MERRSGPRKGLSSPLSSSSVGKGNKNSLSSSSSLHRMGDTTPKRASISDRQQEDDSKKPRRAALLNQFCSIRMMVLLILCFQNSMFTLLRRYSQGVLKEGYSKVRMCVVVSIVSIVFLLVSPMPRSESFKSSIRMVLNVWME